MMYIELMKLLKASGLTDTGGIAKMLISDGLVKVDTDIFNKDVKIIISKNQKI